MLSILLPKCSPFDGFFPIHRDVVPFCQPLLESVPKTSAQLPVFRFQSGHSNPQFAGSGGFSVDSKGHPFCAQLIAGEFHLRFHQHFAVANFVPEIMSHNSNTVWWPWISCHIYPPNFSIEKPEIWRLFLCFWAPGRGGKKGCHGTSWLGNYFQTESLTSTHVIEGSFKWAATSISWLYIWKEINPHQWSIMIHNDVDMENDHATPPKWVFANHCGIGGASIWGTQNSTYGNQLPDP